MPRLEISAVIVARAGDGWFAQTLAALCAQSLASARYEILVIEAGVGAETQMALQAHASRVRVFRQRVSGASAAMNLAAFASQSPRIVYLAAQHPPQPDFLERMVRAHEQYARDGDVIYGALAADAARPLAPAPLLMNQAPAQAWREPDCPISFKRTLLTQHGIFDATLSDGWERVELLWRLRVRRIRLVRAPHAVVRLGAAAGVRDLAARAERQGRCHARLARKHPGPLMGAFAQIDHAAALWAEQQPQAPRILDDLEALAARNDVPAKVFGTMCGRVMAMFRAKGAAEEGAG